MGKLLGNLCPDESVLTVAQDGLLAWEDEGKRVLSYNMSDIRKRVFLQQCTIPELQRYIFARQCFFLFK